MMENSLSLTVCLVALLTCSSIVFLTKWPLKQYQLLYETAQSRFHSPVQQSGDSNMRMKHNPTPALCKILCLTKKHPDDPQFLSTNISYWFPFMSQPHAALSGPSAEQHFRDTRRHQLTSHIHHLRNSDSQHLNGGDWLSQD